MKLYSQQECIKNESSFIKLKKVQYKCRAYIPKIGTKVYNFLEDVELTTSKEESVVIIGPLNEEYTISIDSFINKYLYDDCSQITYQTLEELEYIGTSKPIDILSKDDGPNVWGLQADKDCKFIIETLWNNKLSVNRDGILHDDGDFIICSDDNGKPNLKDMWVVNGHVIKKTYKILES